MFLSIKVFEVLLWWQLDSFHSWTPGCDLAEATDAHVHACFTHPISTVHQSSSDTGFLSLSSTFDKQQKQSVLLHDIECVVLYDLLNYITCCGTFFTLVEDQR